MNAVTTLTLAAAGLGGAATWLAVSYEPQLQGGGRALPKVPPPEVLAQRVSEAIGRRAVLRPAYSAQTEPGSGVLRVYRVVSGGDLTHRYAVLRHDIGCETCADVLLGVLLEREDQEIVSVETLAPWELAAGPLDPSPWLARLTGVELGDADGIRRAFDGLTGASLTVDAVIGELVRLGGWLKEAGNQRDRQD